MVPTDVYVTNIVEDNTACMTMMSWFDFNLLYVSIIVCNMIIFCEDAKQIIIVTMQRIDDRRRTSAVPDNHCSARC